MKYIINEQNLFECVEEWGSMTERHMNRDLNSKRACKDGKTNLRKIEVGGRINKWDEVRQRRDLDG